MPTLQGAPPAAKKWDRKWPGLVEYLTQRLGTPQGAGQERHFYCPFCIDKVGSESSKRKLDVNIKTGRAGCYRCEYKAGGLEKLFRDMNGGALRIEEIVIINRAAKMPIPGVSLRDTVTSALAAAAPSAPVVAKKSVAVPYDCHPLADLVDSPYARTAFRYLERRGATEAMWREFNIGYAWEGRWACHLVFPVLMHGEQVYFTSRNTRPGDLKSLNPSAEEGELTKEDVLLNYDACVGSEVIALTEGPFSCMAFQPIQGCPALATMGKAPSSHQLAMIEGLVAHGLKEVIIAYDPDAAKKTDEVFRGLYGRIPAVSVLPLDHGDPWDRRADLYDLIDRRGVPSLMARVKGRLISKK